MIKNKINKLVTVSAVLLISSVANAQQDAGNNRAMPGNTPGATIPAIPKNQAALPAGQPEPGEPGNNYKTVQLDKLVRPDQERPEAENRKPQLIPVAPVAVQAPVTTETKKGPAGPQRAKPVDE